MSFGPPTEVTGLQGHQKRPDIAGNNLANVNTTGFKSSRSTFAEQLSESIRNASVSSTTIGAAEASATATPMSQSNIVNTGNPLDMAIEGEGYFVVSNGSQFLFTRSGAFGIDSNLNLIDPSTGFLVQRIGSQGEADGFQTAGNSNIRVPYDATLPASATSEITVQGNLSPDAVPATPQTQVLLSDVTYTTNNGSTAEGTTKLADLEQFTGASPSGTITIAGTKKDGTGITTATLNIDGSTTLQDVIDKLNTAFGGEATATLSNGQIKLTDAGSGCSKLDVTISCSDSNLTMPGYFEISTVGGTEVQNVNVTIYDSHGGSHVLSGAFVRTDGTNLWDMVLTSITGSVNALTSSNRRIEGIEFNAADGSYAGLNSGIGDTAQFQITFAHDTSNPQTITVKLGTANKFNGLTQFATGPSGFSTAVIRQQDGYPSGSLSNVSINREGTLIGSFSNGVRKNLATLQIALFRNVAGLESAGNGYFVPSADSGEMSSTQGLSSGAGAIRGGALEKSNADVAVEFVNMVQAQNGFQSNAGTLRVANDILRELTNLIK